VYFNSLPDSKGAWRTLHFGGVAARVYERDFFGVQKNSYSYVADGGLTTGGLAGAAYGRGCLSSGGMQASGAAGIARGRGTLSGSGASFAGGALLARGYGSPQSLGGFVSGGEAEIAFTPGGTLIVFAGVGGRVIVAAESREVKIESELRALFVAAENRTFKVVPEMGIAKDIRGRFAAIKDPAAHLDYEFDWSAWLPDGDSIASFVLTSEGGVVCGQSGHASGVVSVMVSGGTVNTEASVACRITTAAGRVDERTLYLVIRQR
jgi:hypothetical protein